MNELALFAGAGGGILGGKLLGWRTVCAVELDAYCRRVLLARQRDGFLPRFPIWDNVTTFDGKPWRGGWMWSAGDSLAPTYQPQARAQGSKESSPACGSTWFASSVRYDRNTSSWKTAHCLLSEDLPWFSVTLPKWGMMRDGELWERVTSVLPMFVTASGFWPTPNASDYRGAGKSGKLRDRLDYAVERGATKSKVYWPTPCANEDAAGRPGSKMQKMLGNHCEIRGDLTGGTLSADWTEWLMGWPIGHTDLKPLATDKFQQWLRSHGVYSEGRNDL